ncbi:MAG: hypothetical protein KJO91_01510, partial [Gammaproteobacteria bacterium]|nr:hypothetical protein [Gammaproteobacteria bacterium]
VLSVYEATQTQGMDTLDAYKRIADISKIAGSVSTQTENILNQSDNTIAAAERALPLYIELTEGDSDPEMHTKGPALAFLEDAATLVKAGVPQAEAIETAWDNKNPDETEKEYRKAAWETTGVVAANESWEELTESDWYDPPGWFNGIATDEFPQRMLVEYSAVFRSAFSSTGNVEAAKNLATKAMKNTWILTNLNSSNPKEYKIEKYGIPGDSRSIREGLISGLSDDGVGISSTDNITFETPENKQDAIDFEGTRWFEVHENGIPKSTITKDGIETIKVGVERGEIETAMQSSNNRAILEKRIRSIEEEEKRLKALSEGNVYMGRQATPLPFGSKGRKERLAFIQKEKKGLQDELKQRPTL